MSKFRNRLFTFWSLIFLLIPFEQGTFSNKNSKFRVQNGLKGVTVAIVKDEKLVFAKGYGFANEETQIQVTPNHLFRIASVSKLITAVAIMKLVENSKISLDSKVFGKYGILNDDQFLHIKDHRLEKITVRHLLNHSGGWSQHYGDLAFLPKAVAKGVGESLPVNIDSYIKFVTTHKVHFEPGSNSVYSNLGYVILGKVIAKIAGTDYETFVKKEVLEPAGIVDMQLGRSFFEEALPNEVRYYQPEDGQPIEAYDGSGRMVPKTYGGNDIHLLSSAGGWLSSVIDLMKLVVVIDNEPAVKDILSSESIHEMTLVDPNGLDPLGWRATNERGEWWRTGTLPGTSALVKRQPDGFSWVILSNTSNYKGPRLAIEMDRIMSHILLKVDHWPNYDLFSFLNN
ncbi:MAG: serine hydrolase [Bacteroidia bacterium]|nr:serine hydrolase [Bacteroidia bacterium]